MRRIDQATVQKILDAADIVEVVSDFVHLKRRGTSYLGLCPFHNERTPSFSVSKTKGICKCFSCGKGGSAVNFIMELEQMSYYDALKYLAKKYHIEIEEHEMSAEEREAANKRESLLAVNDFALNFFERTLQESNEGRTIGLGYFRERGINEAMQKRFHLGFSPEGRTTLRDEAVSKGFKEDFLIETGLCYRTDRGTVHDRFRGRVIFPVFTVSGKVVAFGGRTLRKDKDMAKYVNSPESVIYRKSYELYGLYQAKQAIVRKDKCILVEGYMDVISMHQSGVENVVASSGTSLTEGQIRLIHRFTENVTVIYDSDPAGIKASLRGIDMLLAEGLNVKVLLLPDGDDPDSFAQNHSSSEVEEYLAANETDFIAFKTRILLEGSGNDPIERSRVIQSVVRSISMIPDDITRTVYIGECGRSLGIDENVLRLQVAKYTAERREKEARDAERARNRVAAGLPAEPDQEDIVIQSSAPVRQAEPAAKPMNKFLIPYERDLVRYVVKYGMMYLCDCQIDEAGNTRPMSVIEYVDCELNNDNIVLSDDGFRTVFEASLRVASDAWMDDWTRFSAELEVKRAEMLREGTERIRTSAADLSNLDALEQKMSEDVAEEIAAMADDFCQRYISKHLVSAIDDVVRTVSTDLVAHKHQLSKIHTKYAKIATERERLAELVPHAVYNLKEALVECDIRNVIENIREACKVNDIKRVEQLMLKQAELNEIKKELARYLGERVLSPKR